MKRSGNTGLGSSSVRNNRRWVYFFGERKKNMSKTPYYITTAIAYTSGKPHIGNNYEIVLADAIARFKRKEGYEVTSVNVEAIAPQGLSGINVFLAVGIDNPAFQRPYFGDSDDYHILLFINYHRYG